MSSTATLGNASSPFWSQTRTLDNVGNVLQLSTTLPTSSGGSLTDNQSFCYDALSRLVWAGNTGSSSGGDHCGGDPGGSTTTGYAHSYSYDAMDRMTSGAAGTVTYTDPSHVHAVTGLSTVPNQYASYDAMGNMTCRNTDTTGSQSCATGTQTGATMQYDNEGRLIGWTAPTGLTASDQFLYDNQGHRVLQRSSTGAVGSTTPTITFDQFTDVTLTNGTSTVTNYYTVAGQRVAMRKGATLSYLVPDFLGSDNIALNFDGTVQAVQLFAPYGSVRYSDQIMPTDYSFTGQRLDGVTGLLYYNARYYDPVGGRFTSSDRVQNNTSGMDPYAYVENNPETNIDPTGERFTKDDGGGAPPGIDDPTALTQLFTDIQDFLNSQNPYVSGAEVTAAVVAAPLWVPTFLLFVILSIPSDSSQPNQPQNTSAPPPPEASPATSTNGSGAQCCNFKRPNKRHFFSKIQQGSSVDKKNTVIMPWVDVNADVAAINAGDVALVKGVYTVNGRSYTVHNNGTLSPTTGNGFVVLDATTYKALGVYKSFGDTAKADDILSRMGVTDSTKEEALSVYKQGGGQ